MLGCCRNVNIQSYQTVIQVDKHRFTIKIDYCANCGNEKSTSNIRMEKNGN